MSSEEGESMNINLDIVIYVCSAITGISAAVAVIVKLIRRSISKISVEVSEKVVANHEEKLYDIVKEISDDLGEFINESRNSDKLQRNSAIATARARINESYNYYMKKGSIDPYSLSVLEDVYESYKAMGGNHLAERQINELKNLRVDSGYLDRHGDDQNEKILRGR